MELLSFAIAQGVGNPVSKMYVRLSATGNPMLPLMRIDICRLHNAT